MKWCAIEPAREPMTLDALRFAANWAGARPTAGDLRTWKREKFISVVRQDDELLRELIAEVLRLRPDLAAALGGE